MSLSYELCKQLKEAGFPLYGASEDRIGKPNDILEMSDGIWTCHCCGITDYVKIDDVLYRIPTLDELIEECGEGFGELQRDNNAVGEEIWYAVGRSWKGLVGKGKTCLIAVAKLYIKLNGKN